jgi:hypothetical protein
MLGRKCYIKYNKKVYYLNDYFKIKNNTLY